MNSETVWKNENAFNNNKNEPRLIGFQFIKNKTILHIFNHYSCMQIITFFLFSTNDIKCLVLQGLNTQLG